MMSFLSAISALLPKVTSEIPFKHSDVTLGMTRATRALDIKERSSIVILEAIETNNFSRVRRSCISCITPVTSRGLTQRKITSELLTTSRFEPAAIAPV